MWRILLRYHKILLWRVLSVVLNNLMRNKFAHPYFSLKKTALFAKKALGQHRDKDALDREANHGLACRHDALRTFQQKRRWEDAPVERWDAQDKCVEQAYMRWVAQAENIVECGKKRDQERIGDDDTAHTVAIAGEQRE